MWGLAQKVGRKMGEFWEKLAEICAWKSLN
jgi:hypothetical protein